MRIIGKYRIARRLGAPIFEKTQNAKYAARLTRKLKNSKKKFSQKSDYGQALNEKQKARFTFGVTNTQFSNYVKEATAKGGSKPGEYLMKKLEMRLDNVVYKIGFANTRLFARQMVNHGHILVNGKKMSIPSYQTKVGDVVTIREGSKSKPLFGKLEERIQNSKLPQWISYEADTKKGEVKTLPKIESQEYQFSPNAIIEFYSR